MTPRSSKRTSYRACPRVAFVAAVVGIGLAVFTASAGAHVTGSDEPVTSGGSTPVTFAFDHGCNGEPTTYLRVQLPAGAIDVEPQNPPGWTSTVTADEVRWDGGSIPDQQKATFVAVMTITQPEGAVVIFPTIQGCPTRESTWIEIADPTNPDPRYPAPQIIVGAGSDAALGAEPPPRAQDAGATTIAPPSTRVPLQDTPVTPTGSEQSGAGLVVFIVVVAIIAGGATVLFLRNRSPKSE